MVAEMIGLASKYDEDEHRTTDLLEGHDAGRRIPTTTCHCLWAVSAPISLATTKHLLVDLNYHYPQHLLLLQLCAAIFFDWLVSSRLKAAAPTKPRRRLHFDIIPACVIGISITCTVQAALHWPNLQSLAALGFGVHGIRLMGFFIFTPRNRTTRDAFRILLLILCWGLIVFYEYRITANGAIFLGLSIVFAGLASKVFSIDEYEGPSTELTYATSIVIALICGFMLKENSLDAYQNLHWRLALTLGLNLVSTTVSFSTGRTWLAYLGKDTDEKSEPAMIPSRNDIDALLLMVGFIGYETILSIRRTYTAPYQLMAFAVACIALDNGRLIDRRDWKKDTSLKTIPDEEEVGSNESSRQSTLGLWGPRLVRLAAISFWLLFILRSRMHTRRPAPAVELDGAFESQMKTDIIISTYREPLHEIQYLIDNLKAIPSLSESVVHIYSKDDASDLDFLGNATGADSVTVLPNYGREGQTYLHHILSHWDDLATHTIFVQGDVHNPGEFFPRVRDYFLPEKTGFLSLGFVGHVCDCETCGDRFGWSDPYSIKHFYRAIYGSQATCDTTLLTYKGQFIASAKRIRGVQKRVWKQLNWAMTDNRSWAHRPEYLAGKEDSMDKPAFGYSLERMWAMLLGCNDMEIAWKCPSLVSGKRIGGDAGDCQCFDAWV